MLINRVSIFKPSTIFAIKNQKLSCDSISFSGTGADGNKMRKHFSGMNCPCCGIKMLDGSDIKRAITLPPNEPSKNVIPKLRNYEDRMHEVEKGTFQLLANLSEKYPNYNLRQLLDTVRDEHLVGLHQEERKIIDRIRGIGGYLSPDSINKLDKTLVEAEDFIKNDNGDATFKRRAFIAKVGDAVSQFPEKDAAQTIFEIAHQMPRAGTSRNAFVVKYSEKNSSNGTERNSHDIINGLLSPSLATVEHVKARSPHVEKGGGANQMNNYLLECMRDNNMRNSMPFWQFVKKHPEFYGEHLQKHIDEIIKRLNAGELRGFELYPVQIARTLRRQSKRKLKPDVSALNPPPPPELPYLKYQKK